MTSPRVAAAFLRRFASKKSIRLPSSSATSFLSRRCLSSSTSEDSPKALDMAFGPVNAFSMNQYAIACTATKQAVIIDCGASTLQELNAFLKWIDDKDYQLTAVWQTHAHLDHVAGLGLLYDKLQQDDKRDKNIPIYLHQNEQSIYNSFEERSKEFGFSVENNKLPDDTQLTFFDDTLTCLPCGNLIFDIIETPGHSPGHVGFYESTSKSFFGGDFIMQGSIGRTDFPTSSPTDMNESLTSFCTTMDDATVIYPGHGQPSLLSTEKQRNPYLQEFV